MSLCTRVFGRACESIGSTDACDARNQAVLLANFSIVRITAFQNVSSPPKTSLETGVMRASMLTALRSLLQQMPTNQHVQCYLSGQTTAHQATLHLCRLGATYVRDAAPMAELVCAP
jgi:hypothetical protein